MDYPSKVLAKAVDEISGLPGIGRKTALRLALHLLKQPPSRATSLGNSLINLVNEIKYCKDCHNFSDFEICEICSNDKRNDETICIVEDVRDVIAIE
ncbi:MAG: recombination protein RecR, partial [Chryseobacterium sp.]